MRLVEARHFRLWCRRPYQAGSGPHIARPGPVEIARTVGGIWDTTKHRAADDLGPSRRSDAALETPPRPGGTTQGPVS
jgi:hypothetical protein